MSCVEGKGKGKDIHCSVQKAALQKKRALISKPLPQEKSLQIVPDPFTHTPLGYTLEHKRIYTVNFNSVAV